MVSEEQSARILAGRYQVGPLLGSGGMGLVYSATDLTLSRDVAVKLLKPSSVSSADAVARFEREAKATARLGHVNIVQVFEFGQDEEDGSTFLVMERLQGETLAERILRGPLSVPLALEIHLQLLDALSVAHESGVLHRDIKPGNIFLTELASNSVLVKLLDFGLAYLLEEKAATKLTKSGIALGSPAYMAPERVQGRRADERGDIYSVAVSLYECIAGCRPYSAETPLALTGKILLGSCRPMSAHRPGLPFELDELVQRALAVDPHERFSTARHMAAAIKALGEVPDVPSDGPGSFHTSINPTKPEKFGAVAIRLAGADDVTEGELPAPIVPPGGLRFTPPAPRQPEPTSDDVLSAKLTETRPWLWPVAVLGVAAIASVGILAWSLRDEEPPSAGPASVASPPSQADPPSRSAPAPHSDESGTILPAGVDPPTSPEPNGARETDAPIEAESASEGNDPEAQHAAAARPDRVRLHQRRGAHREPHTRPPAAETSTPVIAPVSGVIEPDWGAPLN